MKSIFNTKVSFCESVTSEPTKEMSLAKILISDQWKQPVEALRSEQDADKQKRMKNNLPVYTPSGTFSHICQDGLKEHSGFICIDIDEKDNKDVSNFGQLKKLVKDIPNVAYCGLSARGKGYFCIIPVADPQKHREYFEALTEDFAKWGVTIDKACKDVCRKRFVSYDAEPYINTAAEVYSYTLPVYHHTTAEVFGHELTDAESESRFKAVLNEIQATCLDITGDYNQWFEILCGVASFFGESGREYAHEISRYGTGYKADETDKKYTDCVKHNGYKFTLGTFFHYARITMNEHDFDNLIFE